MILTKIPNQSKKTNIPEIWTRGLPDKNKEQFIQALIHDTLILGRLDEILDQYLTELDRSEGSQADYDNPSWAYKTADRIGRRRSLMAVKELIAPAVAKLKQT